MVEVTPTLTFRPTGVATVEEVRRKTILKQLVRRGVLVEDQGETYLADDEDDSEEARALRPLHRGGTDRTLTLR